MSNTVDDAREALLARIKRDAMRVPADQLRNIATAYGILAERQLAERRVTSFTNADGGQYYMDALGRALDPDAALAALRGEGKS